MRWRETLGSLSPRSLRPLRNGALRALIGHCRNRYDFDHEVGMRERRNSDHLRWRGIVVTTVFGAMPGEEFVQHILTKIGRAQYAAVGKWPLHKECEPDQVI